MSRENTGYNSPLLFYFSTTNRLTSTYPYPYTDPDYSNLSTTRLTIMPSDAHIISQFKLVSYPEGNKQARYCALLSVKHKGVMRPYAWANNYRNADKCVLDQVPLPQPIPADLVADAIQQLTGKEDDQSLHRYLMSMAAQAVASVDKDLATRKRKYPNSLHDDKHRAWGSRPALHKTSSLALDTWSWSDYKESPYILPLLQQLNGPWVSFSGLFDYHMFKQPLVKQMRIRKRDLWQQSVAKGGPRKSELVSPRTRLEYLFDQLQISITDPDYIPQLAEVPSPVDDLTAEQFARLDDETALYTIARIQNYISFAAIMRQIIKPAPDCERIAEYTLNRFRNPNVKPNPDLDVARCMHRDTLRVVMGTAVEYEVIEGELVVSNRLLPDLSLATPSHEKPGTIYWSQLEDLAEQYGTNLDL